VPEPSLQRRECLAREEMATRIYPVEKHPLDSYILRLAVPALPSVGDLHLIIGDVQITRLVANLKLQRKDDRTFSFGLHGDGGADMAMVEAWVDQLDFQLPHSSMDTLVKGLSQTENWFGSLGWKSNYGQLKKLKVSLNISMSGDIRTDEHGSWQVVPGSEETEAIFNIGSGGVVLRVINSILAGSGGKAAEEAIFDILWPLLVQLLPAELGTALGTVPKDEGDVGISIALDVRCKSPAAHSVSNKLEKRLCPDHLMQVKAKVETKAHVRAKPVLEKLAEKSEVGVLGTLVKAYEDSAKSVVGGLHSEFVVNLGLTPEHVLSLHARPRMEVPMALIKAMTPQIRTEDFLPREGRLSITAGNFDVRDGAIHLPEVQLDNLHLPVGTETDTIEIRATLDEFTVELEDPSGCAGENTTDVFDQVCKMVGKGSPLSLSAPGVTLGVDRVSGASLDPSGGGDALAMSYAPDGVAELLQGVDDMLATGGNVRNGSAHTGDGAVPLKFQRPHDRALPKWDLENLLRELVVSLGGSVTTDEGDLDDLEDDVLEVKVETDVSGLIYLGPPVLRAMLDGADKDLGYLHFVAAGLYGFIKGSGYRPDEPALVRLSCGGLEMYKLKGEPYAGTPHIARDLREMKDWQMMLLGEPEEFEDMLCFRMKEASYNWLFASRGNYKYWCTADRALGRSFEEALKMQRERLEDASERTAACDGDFRECPARPDGNWFKEFAVYDKTTWPPSFKAPDDNSMFASPGMQWNSAASALNAKK
jgi:hypothetical protein